jgi:hypothetical protein
MLPNNALIAWLRLREYVTQDSSDIGTKVKRIGDKAKYKATRTRSG